LKSNKFVFDSQGKCQEKQEIATRRWRPSKTICARRLHTAQHVGIAIETIVGVMAFDLANAVLLLGEDLHVAILLPLNESLGRGRDPAPNAL